MNEGFIKLFRKFLDWEWYDDINTKTLFIHLLLTANWKAKKWHGITVKRGQLITSQSHLAEQTQLSRQQVRRAIDNLISTNDITKSTTSTYTIITIKNYGKYQDNNQVDNQRATNEQPTSNQRATTTKERKKEKKERNIYTRSKNNRKKIESHVYDFNDLERNLNKANKKGLKNAK